MRLEEEEQLPEGSVLARRWAESGRGSERGSEQEGW